MNNKDKNKVRNSNEVIYSIRAKASNAKDATTGKIVVSANKFHKVIPAVVFTPEKAEKLLEYMEQAILESNKRIF